MLWAKMQESRRFDVFLWSVFGCLEEGKSVESNWAERKFQKNVYPPMFDGCLGLFIALGVKIEVSSVAFQGLPASNGL